MIPLTQVQHNVMMGQVRATVRFCDAKAAYLRIVLKPNTTDVIELYTRETIALEFKETIEVLLSFQKTTGISYEPTVETWHEVIDLYIITLQPKIHEHR